MDDLTPLRQLRADEPGPSASESDRARTALLALIEAGPSADRIAVKRARITRPFPGRPRIWIPVLAATVAVVSGFATLAVTTTGSPARGTSASSTSGAAAGQEGTSQSPPSGHDTLTAALVLREAATSAARQAPATGRYFFSESEYVSDDGVTTASGGTSYQWDGPYLRKFWVGNGVAGLLEDPRVSTTPTAVPSAISAGTGSLTWAQVQHMPTSPGPLRAAIAKLSYGLYPKDHAHGSLARAEFSTISDLLYEAPAPPSLRAALYRLAATLPGIRLVKGAEDLVGRPANEVYMPGGPPSFNNGKAIFFDVSTSKVLGEAVFLGTNPACPPMWSTAVLATGYVNSTTDLPPGTPAALKPASFAKNVPGCPTPSALGGGAGTGQTPQPVGQTPQPVGQTPQPGGQTPQPVPGRTTTGS